MSQHPFAFRHWRIKGKRRFFISKSNCSPQYFRNVLYYLVKQLILINNTCNHRFCPTCLVSHWWQPDDGSSVAPSSPSTTTSYFLNAGWYGMMPRILPESVLGISYTYIHDSSYFQVSRTEKVFSVLPTQHIDSFQRSKDMTCRF